MPYELSWGQASSSLSPGPQGSSQCLLHTCAMLSRYGDVFFYSVPARDPFCSPVISCLTVLPQLQLLCFLFLSSLSHCLISSSSHSSACPHLACEVRLASVSYSRMLLCFDSASSLTSVGCRCLAPAHWSTILEAGDAQWKRPQCCLLKPRV